MKQPAKDISVSVFARTDMGMQRAGNEDAFLVADLTTGNVGLGAKMSTHRVGDRGSLMVVSDGMGGAAAGEIASAMAVKTIREALMEELPDTTVCDRLKFATERANQRIWQYANENRQFMGMGATLTAVLVLNTSAYVAQVGDSRAYLIRGDHIKQLTKDQSLVQLLIDSGAIKQDQINSVPQNVIMQALGTSETVEVAMVTVELCKDDLVIVCTDGLSNKVSADEMGEVLRQAESLNAACRRLVELANERGGEDNITLIAARFDGEALHSAAQSNSITGSFKVLSQGCFDGELAELSSRFTSGEAEVPDVTTAVLNAGHPAEPKPQASTEPESPTEKK
ncbi:MAG TPA: PP2C family serine/threonine-protein phosphatase [Blastocatellia bacterium]|nr:PP2C family serine/threonine-protein phosphatase [Blastocatellia bacterium]